MSVTRQTLARPVVLTLLAYAVALEVHSLGWTLLALLLWLAALGYGVANLVLARGLRGFAAVAVACTCLPFLIPTHLEIQRFRAMERGDGICRGLAEYRTVHGRFPEDLDGLARAAPESVAQTGMGLWPRDFDYEVHADGTSYSLSFGVGAGVRLYRGQSGGWAWHD